MEGSGDRSWAARLLLVFELLTNSPWTPGLAVCLILASYICGYTLTPTPAPGVAAQASLAPLTTSPASAQLPWGPEAQLPGGADALGAGAEEQVRAGVAWGPWRAGTGLGSEALGSQVVGAAEAPRVGPGGLGLLGGGGLGLGRVALEDVLNATGDDLVPPFPRAPKEMRVAVCLVGGARDSDLTVPSILQHLLPAYPRPHLFVHAPLDENSFKLRAFAWAAPNVTVAAVRLYSNWWVDLRRFPRQLVQDPTSPGGTQGMFQYFRLVEGCLPLILQHEAAHGFRFNWILRTRVDTFWRRPPAPLASLDAGYYAIPHGTNCMGYNDRLGLGTWRTSRSALARLSLLRRIEERWPSWRDLNSEMSFKAQLLVTGTKAARASFWFCVVSRRVYRNKRTLMPVASLASPSPLNGAKCRPCTPQYTGRAADAQLAGYSMNAQLGPIKTGVDLCAGHQDWEPGWEAVFDRDAGEPLAQQRQRLMGAGLEECVAGFEALKERAGAWDAAPPRVLCLRRTLGPARPVGAPGTSFRTLMLCLKQAAGAADPRTVLALLGSGTGAGPSAEPSAPWASGVLGQWTQSMEQELGRDGMKLQATALGPGLQSPAGGAKAGQGLEAHVLVLAVQQTEMSSALKAWIESNSMPKVCQLLVAYKAEDASRDNPSGREESTRTLRHLGFWLDSCIMEHDAHAERCTYFSLFHCVK